MALNFSKRIFRALLNELALEVLAIAKEIPRSSYLKFLNIPSKEVIKMEYDKARKVWKYSLDKEEPHELSNVYCKIYDNSKKAMDEYMAELYYYITCKDEFEFNLKNETIDFFFELKTDYKDRDFNVYNDGCEGSFRDCKINSNKELEQFNIDFSHFMNETINMENWTDLEYYSSEKIQTTDIYSLGTFRLTFQLSFI